MSLILSVLPGLFKLALFFLGDQLLSKWLGALQFFLDTGASQELKASISVQYKQLMDSWDQAKAKDPTRAD